MANNWKAFLPFATHCPIVYLQLVTNGPDFTIFIVQIFVERLGPAWPRHELRSSARNWRDEEPQDSWISRSQGLWAGQFHVLKLCTYHIYQIVQKCPEFVIILNSVAKLYVSVLGNAKSFTFKAQF